MKANNNKTMQRDTCVYKIPEWMEVRKVATKEDYEAYKRIYLDTFGNTVDRRISLFLNRSKIYEQSYVWLYKGEYIGIYMLQEVEPMRATKDVNFRVLYNFAIIPTMRSKGLGRLLLSAAITETAKMGCQELLLIVDTNNKIALNLYEQFGFKNK